MTAYQQAETGVILDTAKIEIKGARYFEEKFIPHGMFQSFAYKPTRAGKLLFLGCVREAYEGPKGLCRAYPGGPNAQVVASIYHPYDQLERILEDFKAGRRNRLARRTWRRFRRVQEMIAGYFVAS